MGYEDFFIPALGVNPNWCLGMGLGVSLGVPGMSLGVSLGVSLGQA